MNKAVTFDITVGGNTYPCVLSMGASLDHYEATGREVHEVKTGNQLLTLIYYCAAAGAELRGAELPFTARQFRHVLTPAEGGAAVAAYARAVQDAGADQDDTADVGDDADSGEKKTPQ